MAGFRIEGNTSGNVAEVDSSNQLKVNLNTTDTTAGWSTMLAEIDAGTVTATRYVKAPELTEDYRLRVGVDTILLNDQFPGSNLNTTLWSQQTTTMTIALSGGLLVLNAGSSVATTVNARVQSYQHFPLIGTFPLWVQICAQFPFTPQANNVTEWGLGIATGTSAPTDGVFFRLNASGEFRGVVNYNGTETQSGTLNFSTLVGTNTIRKFVISCSEETAEFWIDDVLVAEVNSPAAQGTLTTATNLPLLLRTYNSNTTSSAQQIKVGQINVALADAHTSKDWKEQMAVMGKHCSQGQTGQTLGTTANYANSANPTALVPTNTTAAAGSTGLGGQTWETDTVAVTTDCIIFSYQNPAGTSTAPGKNLYITGIKLQSYIQTALTGGGYIAQWSLAYGHTAVSLATADGAGTKAPRRIAIGNHTVASGATALTLLPELICNFNTPIVIYPGEFIALVKKKVGTAPSAGTVAHTAFYDGYFE